MTEEFLMRLDEGMLEYFRDMAGEMAERFGIPRAEAVARINERFADIQIDPYPDIMCHEMPEFWAYGLYYARDDGRPLPSGEDGEEYEFSALRILPVPPASSPSWTLAQEEAG